MSEININEVFPIDSYLIDVDDWASTIKKTKKDALSSILNYLSFVTCDYIKVYQRTYYSPLDKMVFYLVYDIRVDPDCLASDLSMSIYEGKHTSIESARREQILLFKDGIETGVIALKPIQFKIEIRL